MQKVRMLVFDEHGRALVHELELGQTALETCRLCLLEHGLPPVERSSRVLDPEDGSTIICHLHLTDASFNRLLGCKDWELLDESRMAA